MCGWSPRSHAAASGFGSGSRLLALKSFFFKGTRLPIQHSRHCAGPDFFTPAVFSCWLRLGLAVESGGGGGPMAHAGWGLSERRERREVSKTNRKAGDRIWGKLEVC